MGSLYLRLVLPVTKGQFNVQHRIRLTVFPEDSLCKGDSLLALSGSENIYKGAKKFVYGHKNLLFVGFFLK